jgi:alkylhydroperoxidase/carboxymuconolactone decarboxylase family protein YurZ
VALLASQGPDVNLGYHLFLALMVGISANDVYDILLLTGVYAGVNRLTTSLKVAHATFDALIDAAHAGVKTPGDVFRSIAKACAP